MKRHNVRRLLALVLVAALCLLCGAAAQPNATEIHIYSADDLVQLSKSCKLDTYSQGKTVYLDNDVDLSGSDFVPIPTFGGMFEGQGHTVSGLELSGDASHMGLFRYVQAVGTVRDLKITGNIICLCCNFFYKLSAHVLKCILKLDLFCDCYTIIGNEWSTKRFIQNYVTSLRSDCYTYCIC